MKISQHLSYSQLLQYARKVTRHIDEAEDLLQSILLAAIEQGRTDLSCIHNRRWLYGALRKRAAFDARSAVRRQKREASVTLTDEPQDVNPVSPDGFVDTLPPSLKTTAQLALAGHTKAEIGWLLRVSDAALRQRIAQIKRRWRTYDGRDVSGISTLKGELAFGQIRQALLKMSRPNDAILASHDPDGHLFMVSSQNGRSRQPKGAPTNQKEINDVQ